MKRTNISNAAWKAALLAVLGGTPAAPGSAAAASFPAPLLGKSVTVKWTANRQQRFEGSGQTVSRSINATMQVYISTAGRAFGKEAGSWSGQGGGMRGGRGGAGQMSRSFDRQQAPGDASDSAGRRANVIHFENGALLVDRQMIEGARRVSITFDGGYSSCNARVIVAHEGGRSALRGRGDNGQPYEILSINISTPSCSVSSGNVFGGE